MKAGASAFRFDVMEEKEGTQGQTVLEVLTEFFKLASLQVLMSRTPGSNFIIFGKVLMYFLPN